MTGKQRRVAWERRYLLSGLIECKGHREKTAEYLGFSSRSIRNWLNKYPDIKKAFQPKGQNL